MLDPIQVGDVSTSEYVVEIFGGLVTLDTNLEVQPDIAQSWEVSNGGKTYTFTLRDDVVFHTGNTRRVTAEDVKYSIERAAAAYHWTDHRHRIEHEQVVAPEDMPRFAKLGIIASLQPCHAVTDLLWVESRVGPERMPGAYAWQSFVRLGTRICLGTDWPVQTLDPRVGLYEAVTRKALDGAPPGGRQPEESLTIEQALKGYTLDSAYAEHGERKKGSIEAGKYADLTILAQDPTAIDPDDLLRLEVLGTIVEGRSVYAADDRWRV